MRESLTEIADRYGCDKGLQGPSDEWGSNNFTDVYEAFLGHLREEPIRLLEIGIGIQGEEWDAAIAHGRNREGAASLRMWSDYLGNGQILGADINDASGLVIPRVQTLILDQSDRAQLRRFAESLAPNGLDVIVDDGSHRASHQQITLEELSPLLRSGGLYFIEDLVGDVPGRHGDSSVVNTRSVLSEFASRGVVPSPHAFADPSFLETFSQISFHSPRVEVGFSQFARGSAKKLLRLQDRRGMHARFVPNSHKLVCLRRGGTPSEAS